MIFLFYLLCYYFCRFFKGCCNTSRILSASLCHVRTATAAAADKTCDCFD